VRRSDVEPRFHWPSDCQRERCRNRAAIVSVLHVNITHIHRQGSGREQLLALFTVRRGLESGSSNGSAGRAVATMTDTTGAASSRARTVRELNELIAALDRRVPHVERVGEISIARTASALRSEALKRIEELELEAAAGSSLVPHNLDHPDDSTAS
jgi:hypothetical protein